MEVIKINLKLLVNQLVTVVPIHLSKVRDLLRKSMLKIWMNQAKPILHMKTQKKIQLGITSPKQEAHHLAPIPKSARQVKQKRKKVRRILDPAVLPVSQNRHL